MFTPEQAQMFGDIVAERVMRDYKLVNDPALNAHLQAIADRMAALSNAGKVHVELFDFPEVNAFTFPGGRVLISRKLVSYAKSEDELAGVLAHEFGHVLSHDPERDQSMLMRKVLNVNSVGDRHDIEEKYNRLLDAFEHKHVRSSRGESEHEQQIADQLAVWLMARAGYDPQAYTQLWDRLNELKSNTGSWLTDFFGTTKPEAKRLRIALKAVGNLPQQCISPKTVTEAEFKSWQQSVAEASRSHRAASLHDVVSERKLDPALRTDLSHLRFSPDGKWILGQDDASVFVFSREPLEFRFRIDAPDAHLAQFSPDSSAVVFYDTNFRVERWNLSLQKREWVHEVVLMKFCMNTALSNDGLYFACVTPQFELLAMDVASGQAVFEKKGFYAPTIYDQWMLFLFGLNDNFEGEIPFFHVEFSPDGHYLICARNSSYMAVDMTRKSAISLPRSIHDRIGNSFAFLGNDRIVGLNSMDTNQAAVVEFPSGKILNEVRTGRAHLEAPSHGTDYVILRPAGQYPVGVLDVKQSKPVMANRVQGFDVYDDKFISERKDGELGLYNVADNKLIASVAVPTGPLGRPSAADVSPDFTTLALSERTRGGVWDLKTGQRKALMRGFRAAYVAQDGMTYLDFPKYDKTSRMLVKMNPADSRYEELIAFDKQGPVDENDGGKSEEQSKAKMTISDIASVQTGPYLVGWRGGIKNDQRELVIRDVNSAKELWTRNFVKGWPERFFVNYRSQRLTLQYSVEDGTARKMISASPALKAQLQYMKSKDTYLALLEVLNLASGTPVGSVIVDFGRFSFKMPAIWAAGDNVVIGDRNNRTLAYSLTSGREVGHAFGTVARLADDGTLLAIENNVGQVALYSLPTMEKRDELSFGSGVAFAVFSNDDKRLFVLTKDHTAYQLKLGSNQDSAAAAAK